MSYKIEECSIYAKSIVVKGIPIYIFDKHNMALPAWGTICNRIGKKVNLISFDTHTDTLPAFNCYLHAENQDCEEGLHNPLVESLIKEYKYNLTDFSFQDVFIIAIEYIRNTEQIKTAYDFGYLQSYTVVHKLGADGYEEYDKEMGYKCRYYYNDNFEWNSIFEINDPVIVDFDLDYFNSGEDFSNDFVSNILPILKRAVGVTIASEPEYFNELKKESSLLLDDALKRLLDIIKEALDSVDENIDFSLV